MLFNFVFIIGVIDYFFVGVIGIDRLPLVILGNKISGLTFNWLPFWLIILVLKFVQFLLILELLIILLKQVFVCK